MPISNNSEIFDPDCRHIINILCLPSALTEVFSQVHQTPSLSQAAADTWVLLLAWGPLLSAADATHRLISKLFFLSPN